MVKPSVAQALDRPQKQLDGKESRTHPFPSLNAVYKEEPQQSCGKGCDGAPKAPLSAFLLKPPQGSHAFSPLSLSLSPSLSLSCSLHCTTLPTLQQRAAPHWSTRSKNRSSFRIEKIADL
eukprot:6189447-Pleurochrysis_carterae.AAC.3